MPVKLAIAIGVGSMLLPLMLILVSVIIKWDENGRTCFSDPLGVCWSHWS